MFRRSRGILAFVATVTLAGSACSGDLPTGAGKVEVEVVQSQAHDELPLINGGCIDFAYEDYAGWHGVFYNPEQYLEPGQTVWYLVEVEENVGKYSGWVDDGWLTYDYNPETHLYDLPVWNPWWHTVYTYLQCSE